MAKIKLTSPGAPFETAVDNALADAVSAERLPVHTKNLIRGGMRGEIG
jgi:hypothetical protein